MPFGTSCSLPSMMSLGTLACLPLWCVDPRDIGRSWLAVARIVQRPVQKAAQLRRIGLEVAGILKVRGQQIVAMRAELDTDRGVPLLRWRDLQDLLAGIEDGVHVELVFLELLDAAADGARLSEFQCRIGKLGIVKSEPKRLSPQ